MRIGIYARVSTKDQSCELQVRDLRTYCTARGFDLVREYVDVGQSGAKDSRPELNKLMDDARKRQFDASWCGDLIGSPAPPNTCLRRWKNFGLLASSSSAIKKTSTRAA